MPSQSRLFATPITFTSTVTLDVFIDLNGGEAALDDNDAAYPTIAAGSYDPFKLALLIAQKIRQWIYDALVANANTSTPSAVADIDIDFSFAEVPGNNTSLFSLVIGPSLGGSIVTGIGTAVITDLSIDNSASAGYWLFEYGLARQRTASVTPSITSGVATFAGLFQSMHVWSYNRSEVDSKNITVYPTYTSIPTIAGSIYKHRSSHSFHLREYQFINAPEEMCGTPRLLATIHQLEQTNRDSIEFREHDTSVSSTINSPSLVSDHYLQEGQYLLFSGHVTRGKTLTDPTDITLWEKIASTIEPAEEEPLEVISELHGMIELGLLYGLIVYESVDHTGLSTFVGELYEIYNSEELRLLFQRGAEDEQFYDVTLQLVRVDKPTLASVGT